MSSAIRVASRFAFHSRVRSNLQLVRQRKKDPRQGGGGLFPHISRGSDEARVGDGPQVTGDGRCTSLWFPRGIAAMVSWLSGRI
jgi:hypothetical protein